MGESVSVKIPVKRSPGPLGAEGGWHELRGDAGATHGGSRIQVIKAELQKLKPYFKCFRYRYEHRPGEFYLNLEFRTNNNCARVVLSKVFGFPEHSTDVSKLGFEEQLRLFTDLHSKVAGFGRALKEEVREASATLRNVATTYGTYGTFNGRFVKAVFRKGVPTGTLLHSPIDRWAWQLVNLEVAIPRGEEEGVLEELRHIYDYLQAHYNLEYLYSLMMNRKFVCKCDSCGKEWREMFEEAFSNMIVCPHCKHPIYTNGLNGFLKYCKPAY